MTSYDICVQQDDVVQLNPVDLYYNKCLCIPWAMFYSYDISASKLKDALHRIATEYPVLCGRLVSNSITGIHVEVKKGTGFSFTDVNSDLTLLQALTQSRVHQEPATYPSFAKLPFFLEELNVLELINHDTPVFKVKLVHYKDGTCSLGASIEHSIADAQRLANLFVEISRAYRGETLCQVDYDRSRLWPDQLLRKIDLGLSPQTFPRECKCPTEGPKIRTFPGNTYSIENIYFPMEDIEAIKRKVMDNMNKEVDYISKVDVLSAIYWMLQCELKTIQKGFSGVVKTARDLNITETSHIFFMELISNKSTLIPANYFGNGFVWTEVQFPKTGPEQNQEDDLFNTLVKASLSIRKQIMENRFPKKQAQNILNVYKQLNDPSEDPSLINSITSYSKMPLHEIDFGQGPPVYPYAITCFPFQLHESSISPGGLKNGIFLNIPIINEERQRAINSSVLQELCPGAHFLSEMSPLELARFFSF
eukprot:g4785.t1